MNINSFKLKINFNSDIKYYNDNSEISQNLKKANVTIYWATWIIDNKIVPFDINISDFYNLYQLLKSNNNKILCKTKFDFVTCDCGIKEDAGIYYDFFVKQNDNNVIFYVKNQLNSFQDKTNLSIELFGEQDKVITELVFDKQELLSELEKFFDNLSTLKLKKNKHYIHKFDFHSIFDLEKTEDGFLETFNTDEFIKLYNDGYYNHNYNE